MEFFCGDKNEYIKYLGKEEAWHGQYIDPDTTHGNKESQFYSRLKDFLTMREFDDNWKYSFHPEKTKNNERPTGIWVTDSNNAKPIYLRSDQFGFSAPQKKNTAWNNKYPYASYLELGGAKEFVAECIWDTRTLGGCFLWPLISAGSWKSMYNINRGVRSYIEDRVDLTLYEIQSFYNVLEENKNEKDSEKVIECLKNKGCILLCYKDKYVIYEWLKHFKTFKRYIDFFCFRPFVDDKYQVIDIIESEWEKDKVDKCGFTLGCKALTKESVDGYRMSKKKRIETIKDREKIKQILNNVKNMTVRRTKYMEDMLLKNKEMCKHWEKR